MQWKADTWDARESGTLERKAQGMEKVYIQVHELLTSYNAPFSELVEMVKSKRLSVYYMKFCDYIKIDDFNIFVDDYIERERKRLENQYNNRKHNIIFPSERYRELQNSMSSYWGKHSGFREAGEGQIIKNRYDNAIKRLENREQVAKEILVYLFVRASEYANIGNREQSGKGGRKKVADERIQRNKDACKEVELLYFTEETKQCPYGKDKLKELVGNVLNSKNKAGEPEKVHDPTFNEWYSKMVKLGYARKQGNPHKSS